MNPNMAWYVGLFASIAIAVAGQADQFPHPYDHIFSLGGIIGTAISGYMAQRPRREWTEAEREARTGSHRRDQLPPTEPPQAA